MDEIKVYEDEVLMDLRGKFAVLESEETAFFLDKQNMNVAGRAIKDVATEIISIYEKINEHLKSTYAANSVADSWITMNQVSSNLLKKTWL